MQFSQEEKDLGKIVIELFKNYAPKTCENFRLLCTGELGRAEKTSTKLHYKDSIIHRVVPNGWVQGGGENYLTLYHWIHFFNVIFVFKIL